MTKPIDAMVANALRPSQAAPEAPLTELEATLALGAVAEALARRRQLTERPVRWRWAFGGAIAATLVALFAWWVHRSWQTNATAVVHSGIATASHGASSRSVSSGEVIGLDERLRTPTNGRLTLHFADGSVVALEEQSEVVVSRLEAEHRLVLHEGVLRISASGREVPVVVEIGSGFVRGLSSSFTVETRAASNRCVGGASLVSVDEGSVEVRSNGEQLVLNQGQHELVGCLEPPALPTPPPVEKPVTVGRTPPVAPVSSLERMNAEYAKAMALKREGQYAAAAGVLHHLRTSFPAGPLDEPAAVEELRLLEHVDPASTRRAAEAYLRDYPDGYARDIAERALAP